MSSTFFLEMSVVIVFVTFVSLIMRAIRQPLIIGYILTGILLSPFALNLVHSTDTFATLSRIGVTFLLFTVGLHLNPAVLKSMGKVSLLAGILQVILTFIGGAGIASLLGYDPFASLVLGIALAFSSTIIVMKILGDKQDLESVYGQISVGILIVQDLLVFFLLLALPLLSSGENGASILVIAVLTLAKGLLLLAVLLLLMYFIFPRFDKFISSSNELLFVFSLGWCFAVASVFAWQGFSMEIGALLAGIALSMSPYHHQISSRIRPLRDFFIIVFFVLLGTTINFDSLASSVLPIIALSLFVLILKPLIVMIVMAFLGHRKRNNFYTGISLAQISEFSFIFVGALAAAGYLGAEGNGIVTVVTSIGFITIAVSTYGMNFGDTIYAKLLPLWSLFERKGVAHLSQREHDLHKKYDLILFGSNRIGLGIVQALHRQRKKVLVVDFNPDIIQQLSEQHIECLYGDSDDIELLNELDFRNTKMVVSTIPTLHTNLLLASIVKRINPTAIIVVVSQHMEEAQRLYAEGASYVIMPHFISGKYLSKLLETYGFDRDKFAREGQKHAREIKVRLAQKQSPIQH